MSTVVRSTPAESATRRSAVRQIGVFLGVTFALITVSTTVALAEHVDVRRIDEASALGQTAMYLQAFFPLVGALAARLVGRADEGGAGWGFRRAPWSAVGRAWALAVGVVLSSAVLVWATGVGGFDAGGFGPIVLAGLTVLPLPYVLLAIGEDIGWRGLLATRLAEHWGPRVVVLASGLAWSVFHWPLIIWLGGTPEGVPVWYALVMFTVGTTALGAMLAGMQLQWGIWPGVIMHAVLNATRYHVVDPLTSERAHTTWFSTETGLFEALVLVVAAVLWFRRRPLVEVAGGGTRVQPD